MSDSYALLDTVDLAYSEIAGSDARGNGSSSGSPLILIHGLGGSQADWPFQTPAFATRFRVITLDLRGHGRSPKPPGPYRMSQLAADVALLLMRRQARPAHVVGLSLGGAVAQQLAIDYPELVRSLVLVNTASRFVSTQWRQRLLGARRFADVYLQGMDKVAENVAGRLFPLLDQAPMRAEAVRRIAANDLAAYRASLWAVARFNVTFLLDLIHCPTLVVAGENDTTVPIAPKQLLAQRIRGSRWLVIAGSGHATPLDQPAAFNQAVIEFLEAVECGSPLPK